MDSTSSSPHSIVSRARTALHSAAAKAEKVLTDIKSDLKSSDRSASDGDRPPRRRSKEMDGSWDGSYRRSKSREISGESGSKEDLGTHDCKTISITPTSVLKKLALAIENAKDCSVINDLLDPARGSYLVGERASLSFSAVKSLMLREKDKSDSDSQNEEETNSLVARLFGSEELSSRYISTSVSMGLKDIRGAPIGSFIVRVSEIIGHLKSLQKMASFWLAAVTEMRNFWMEGNPIPHVPVDEKPDLNSCLLHQQLQVINCCIARKLRRAIAVEALDSLINQINSNNSEAVNCTQTVSNQTLYAKMKTGEYVLRLGADQPFGNLEMLETGEPIYSPVTQEGPVFTEEHIREAEEFVLRTGSLGAGCSQLLSDMQAFKAANPGCILEDFIRWYSPPDWREAVVGRDGSSSDAEFSSKRGHLSRRMQKEGNLWRELWETAKALPAVQQAPLFDEDLVVESIFANLEEIQPLELFKQLFISILSSNFMIAETALSVENNLSKLFNDCKEYVIAACREGLPKDNLNYLCRVYETVEMIILRPEDVIELTKQAEEANSAEPKSLFRKFGLSFSGRDRQNSDSTTPKEQKKPDEKGAGVFTNLFDGKRSLFSKKNKKSDSSQPAEPSDESSWTIV